MVADLNNNLKSFNQISLSELNSQASFLNRIDTKYLLTEEEFKNILKDLEEDFYVLEINSKSIFQYESVYMDTEDYWFYYQHQNWEENRTKIRTRKYVDSDIAFFEFKQKQDWITRKFRYQFKDLKDHWIMTNESNKFFEWVYQSFYFRTPEEIFPSLTTKYKRITLWSKSSEERLTIDFDIKLENLRNNWKYWNKVVSLDNLVIIESKSMVKNWLSSKILKKYNIKKSDSCSKYSLWLAYHWVVKDISRFKSTMRIIEKIKNSK